MTSLKIEKSLFDMSEQMPRSATQLAEIAEAGGQLGVKAKDISSFTKTIAMIALPRQTSHKNRHPWILHVLQISWSYLIPKLKNLIVL
ncbi:phage tail tape measure protein [Paenibacillus larvae]|nr:phage tail tape measure protein [Paenibacillus larvae]MDT2305717.1 phage tail tape measure protein [Paenibacillus larvae]